MLNYKAIQGFAIKGMDFDSNYGKDIYGCFEFEFKNHLISVSTGAVMPSRNNYPVSYSEILVTNKLTSEEEYIRGTVQDAIEFVLKNS